MLKLTRKVEYALIALRHIQSKGDENISSAKEIADAYGIPAQLLAKVLQQLAREKIIDPVQGPAGGYRMKKDLESINLTDFFELLEGPVGLMDCFFDSNCNQHAQCNIKSPILKINDSIRTLLDKMSVADVMK
ncbi:MAG: Rrf2 family transcriptional regulator [Candidatus Marinimicrobia bacterium]|nr:Rrf2 family transcriptional regulator [Candidatus Neomarinimicrobiota bacterium]